MNRKKRKSSYNLAVHIIAAMVMAALLTFCIVMISGINQRMNESAGSNLLYATQVIENNLENYIDKDFESLEAFGVLVKAGVSLEDGWMEELCRTIGFEWIGFAPNPGYAGAAFTDSFVPGEQSWHGEWKPEEKGYSGAYYGESGGLQSTLWVPVYEEGEWIGTVFGDVLLTKYYSDSVFTFHGGKGRTYLFNGSNGKWILKSLGKDGLPNVQHDIYSLLIESGNPSEEIDAFRQAVGKGQIGTTSLRFNGEQSYLCFMPLTSSSDWYIVTVIAKDVLLKESTQVRRMIQLMLLVFCCAILCVAVVFIIWQKRKIKLKEACYREALFTNIFSNVDSVFLIYDKAKQETAYVSDNINRMLGLERDQVKADASLLFDWCGIKAGDSVRTAFFTGKIEQAVNREVCVENEVGLKSRFFRIELIPADLGQEIVMLTDITADKDIQNSFRDAMERAEAASRAKDQFLSSMSHDIRTPMNGIIGMTAIAAAHLDDKARVKECLNKINEASAHLLNLINEVLDMSKIESGKMELSEEPFNLGHLIQEVLDLNLPGIKKKKHSIHVHIHSMEHEHVMGDPDRMQRVITNLLSNAIKYTPEGGAISMEIQEKPPEVKGYGCYEITVQDNGIGMSPEFQQRLFQPFEREDDVKLRKIQGTGLGMAIVQNIVSLMMGRIEVKSRKGQGTTFRLAVNLKLDKYEYIPSEKLDKLPVLVVDDDLNVCESVTSMLEDIGMSGEWADNGLSAVEMVFDRHSRREDYLAVLLDWQMPGMDGIDTARRIRAEVGDEVPVIILTAYDWSEIEDEAREAGVSAFMSKPIYRAKLMKKMLTLIDATEQAPVLSEQISSNKIPEGKRVLVAEDNQLNYEIMAELLGMLKLEVVAAEDGKEAVDYFAESEAGYFDLILMDIQMPRMNGYEAARRIRKMEREDGKTIPIIAMTADAFVEDIRAAAAAGMNEHLSKPIYVEHLVQVLERYLANP